MPSIYDSGFFIISRSDQFVNTFLSCRLPVEAATFTNIPRSQLRVNYFSRCKNFRCRAGRETGVMHFYNIYLRLGSCATMFK